jgi:adenylate cyclase
VATHQVTRKLAAVVAADVAGYARLMGLDEEGTLRALNAHRREVFDPGVSNYGGRVVKTIGDGILMEFPSVVDALRCSLDVQRAMGERSQAEPVDRRIRFRIGINLGDVICEDGDIYGDGVNIAARLEALAEPGGICVSQAVIDQVKQKLAIDVEDMGAQALKNIEAPIRAYRVFDADGAAAPAGARADESAAMPRAPERPSLAVLPFRNLNRDADDDYIADGISLGIQTLLVQLSGLFMINACADQAYREGRATAAEAMRDHPVRYALEGAAQRVGGRVRVTAQLSDLRDNAVIWADRYDRDLEDVFALQDEVTREIISSLSAEILGADLRRIWTTPLAGGGAWEYYLRGVSHFYKYTREDNTLARQMSEKIYALHPDKMLGPAYIAMSHWVDATRGWSDSPEDSIAQAEAWAERSLASEELNNGLGYVILGSVRLLEEHFDEALALVRKGVAYRANCPFALAQLASIRDASGDPHGAVKAAREALNVRMVFPPALVNVLAIAYRDCGEYGQSVRTAQEAVRIDPDHTDAYVTLCSAHALAGDAEAAREAARRVLEIDPGFTIAAYARHHPYRDAALQARVAGALRAAGLPD